MNVDPGAPPGSTNASCAVAARTAQNDAHGHSDPCVGPPTFHRKKSQKNDPASVTVCHHVTVAKATRGG